MRAVKQAYAYGLSRIGLQNRGVRIAVYKRAENMGGVVAYPQALGHRLAALIYAHNTRIIVGARMLRRIESLAVLVEQQGKIMQE